jgi:hypothetical protein
VGKFIESVGALLRISKQIRLNLSAPHFAIHCSPSTRRPGSNARRSEDEEAESISKPQSGDPRRAPPPKRVSVSYLAEISPSRTEHAHAHQPSPRAAKHSGRDIRLAQNPPPVPLLLLFSLFFTPPVRLCPFGSLQTSEPLSGLLSSQPAPGTRAPIEIRHPSTKHPAPAHQNSHQQISTRSHND